MKVDIEKLKQGLEQLTGKDYMEAARYADNTTPSAGAVMPVFNQDFQARIAAKALGVSYEEVMNLQIGEFAAALGTVFVFLASSASRSVKTEQMTNLLNTVEKL